MKRANHISSFVAAGGLILLLIAPLCGLPVAVPGIPVWYQDTFFIALICGWGVGLISLLLYLAGVFQQVLWNLLDDLVLFVFIFLLIISCQNNVTTQDSTSFNPIWIHANPVDEPLTYESILDSVMVIPLEFTEESALKRIYKVRIWKNRIVVLDELLEEIYPI